MGKWTWLSLALLLVLAAGTALYAGVPISIRQAGAIGRTVTDTPAASVGTDAPTTMFMEVKASKQGVIPGAARYPNTTPLWWAEAAIRCTPGSSSPWIPRSVLPSTAMPRPLFNPLSESHLPSTASANTLANW
jgi:hypothetical protein